MFVSGAHLPLSISVTKWINCYILNSDTRTITEKLTSVAGLLFMHRIFSQAPVHKNLAKINPTAA